MSLFKELTLDMGLKGKNSLKIRLPDILTELNKKIYSLSSSAQLSQMEYRNLIDLFDKIIAQIDELDGDISGLETIVEAELESFQSQLTSIDKAALAQEVANDPDFDLDPFASVRRSDIADLI